MHTTGTPFVLKLSEELKLGCEDAEDFFSVLHEH